MERAGKYGGEGWWLPVRGKVDLIEGEGSGVCFVC